MSNENAQAEMEERGDDHAVQMIVTKKEERLLCAQTEFETVSTRFWNLLKGQNPPDKNTVTKDQYCALLSRIYRVLAPLYRDEEMRIQVSQEWVYDSHGCAEMDQNLFMKFIFRVAHQWATSVDINEYIELLTRIYERITHKKVARASGATDIAYPHIQVTIDQDKQPQHEDFADPEWESCDEEEEEDAEQYNYETREEKKYKQRKPEPEPEAQMKDVFLTARDPFYYKEKVLYYHNDGTNTACKAPSNEDFEYDVLTDHENIFPLGYPTEQYMAWIKNDVYKALQEQKIAKKKQINAMKRDLFSAEKDQKMQPNLGADRERGLIEENNRFVQMPFSMYRSSGNINVKTSANIHDMTYNALRVVFKENSSVQIRPSFEHPQRKGWKDTNSDLNAPLKKFSIFGHNPALERRLNYVLTTCRLVNEKSDCQMWVNVNYLICDPVYDTAYRADVQRVETNHKMSIKPNEEFTRDEEFNCVSTSFREVVQIMLQKKFESFFTIKLQGDTETAAKRDDDLWRNERKRKNDVRKIGSLTAKQLWETFDSKDYLKVIRGPFYRLQSKEGPREDNFATIAQSDLITIANKEVIKLLILAKPRGGKTTLAKQLQQRLNLVRVSADAWIEKMFVKIAFFLENPPEAPEADPEAVDADGNPLPAPEPPSPYTPLEQSVQDKLKAGEAPSDEEICQMLKELIDSPEATTQGFVLDLDYAYNETPNSWFRKFEEHKLLEGISLTHIVELEEDNEEIAARVSNLWQTPADGRVFSKWERDLRENRKPPVDENGDPIEEEEEELAKWKKIYRNDTVIRVCDNEANIQNELQQYESAERPDVDKWIVSMHHSTYIKFPASGLTPDEIAETVVYRLKPNPSEPVHPVAKIIEGGGDFAGLLSQDVNVDEGQLPRQYSLWRTTDPVALKNGRVVPGSGDFAAFYANNVFVFENEDNLKKFVSEPRKYLESAPAMPPTYNILLHGPRGAGVKSQARKLNEHYGWRVVDFNQIVRNKLAEILALPVKPPNNLRTDGPCMVCLSNEELQEIKDGKPFAAWKFLPWVMEYLGVPLDVKPVVVKEEVAPNLEEMTPEQLKAYEKEQKKKADEKKKKEKEEADAKAAKEERARKRAELREANPEVDLAEHGLEETEEEIKIDDLSIEQLCVKREEDGSFPKIGSIVMYGFPQTEIQINKMKEFGIVFDKIIHLNDQNEEEPGKCIKERMSNKGDFVFNFEEETERSNKVLANIKEFIGEENVLDVDCNGSIKDVFIKIQTKIDPFFSQADAEDIKFDWSSLPAQAQTADGDDIPRRGPRSDFGDYCPVTYVNSGYLVKGKADFESFVFGKSFRFAGEKEQEEFKFNPDAFLKKVSIPLAPPEPKIMIVGLKGAGVTTQIEKLCKKFKINSLDMKEEFLKLMNQEKEKRKRARLLARGFKEPEPNDNPDEEQEPVVDEEIENDPPEFLDNIAKHYEELLQTIMPSSSALVMDGHWTTLPEDLEVNLADTLIEARRTPEVVIMLRCKEANTFARRIDDAEIKREYEADVKKRNEEMKAAYEKDHAEKLAEVTAENKNPDDMPEDDEGRKPEAEIQAAIKEAMTAWEDERKEADAQALEDDPVPDEKTRREAIEEKMREQIEKDTAYLEELAEKFRENGVEVIDNIATDISADYVHIKILDKLKSRMQHRRDLIEREQAESLPTKDVKFYEESFTYKHSKFGLSSPLSPFNPSKNKENTVLYRERLYFLASQEEKERFLLEPSKYTIGCEPVPQDITYRSSCAVIGLPASGKTALAEIISSRTGLVHLQPEQIIESFIARESVFSFNLRRRICHQGDEVDDATFIAMLKQRVNMRDCVQNGFVLDGYPQTRNQAVLLAEAGILFDNVFQIQVPIETVYNRTVREVQSSFDCDRTILVKRLTSQAKSVPETAFFYNKFYNSVVAVDGQKSRWYMEDVALEAIERVAKARLEFARDLYFGNRPCVMKNLNYDRAYVKQSISQFGYMCPVSWKVQKKFINCTHMVENCVLFDNFFFYFAGENERRIFCQDPTRFTQKLHFSHERNIPKRYRAHKAACIISQEKALLGHCPVTLKDEEKVEVGSHLTLISFKDARFVFSSQEKASRFFANPSRYHQVQLPVKMPPPKEPFLLHQLQKQDDCKTFMAQSLGTVVTRALREVGENRLKYPTLSVKETMLKLFAIFLKAENPANTEYMREKYLNKMQTFIHKCEVPQELYDLSKEKQKQLEKGKNWPQFKEDYYNKLGAELDTILKQVPKEKMHGFSFYMK